MKRLIFPVVGVLVVLVGAAFFFSSSLTVVSSEDTASAAPLPLPEWMDPYGSELRLADLRLETKDGQPFELEEGKVHVVNFWARWCGPCIGEMPSLAELARAMDDQGVEIIAASTLDGEPADVEDYIARQRNWDGLDFAYPFAPDITNQLGSLGLPATVIFDKTGKGVAQHFAPADWAADDIKAFLAQLAS